MPPQESIALISLGETDPSPGQSPADFQEDFDSLDGSPADVRGNLS